MKPNGEKYHELLAVVTASGRLVWVSVAREALCKLQRPSCAVQNYCGDTAAGDM